MINIKAIWENQKPTGDIIIKTRIVEIPHLNCFAGTNHILGHHLFILSVSNNVSIPELKGYRFKGVEIFTVELGTTTELNIYLLENDLRDIFSLFIQNVLEDIEPSVTEIEAINSTFKVVLKWKKLFDKINFSGLKLERQKGLIGELLFLNYLLSNEKSAAIAVGSWTSTEQEFQSKDFTIGSRGVEIKFTAAKQPRIKISSERQLDSENFDALFLVLYSAEAVKANGISLNSIIEQTRQTISNEDDLNLFNGKLQLNGYFEEDKEHYGRMFAIKKTFTFLVSPGFPRIVKSDLPIGIYDTSYSIEISAVENYMLELEEILLNFY
jgi:hypothetical protein